MILLKGKDRSWFHKVNVRQITREGAQDRCLATSMAETLRLVCQGSYVSHRSNTCTVCTAHRVTVADWTYKCGKITKWSSGHLSPYVGPHTRLEGSQFLGVSLSNYRFVLRCCYKSCGIECNIIIPSRHNSKKTWLRNIRIFHAVIRWMRLKCFDDSTLVTIGIPMLVLRIFIRRIIVFDDASRHILQD